MVAQCGPGALTARRYLIAAISAANMLGWTVFLGLSSLFVALVFTGSRLETAIRIAILEMPLLRMLPFEQKAFSIPAEELVDGLLWQVHGSNS